MALEDSHTATSPYFTRVKAYHQYSDSPALCYTLITWSRIRVGVPVTLITVLYKLNNNKTKDSVVWTCEAFSLHSSRTERQSSRAQLDFQTSRLTMEKQCLNTSISFEIPVDDVVLRTPQSRPRTPRLISTPSRGPLCESDLTEKIEKANQRRSSVLAETRTRNEQHFQKAISKCEEEKEKLVNKSTELLVGLEEDLALKAKRRQQLLEEKVFIAKKQTEKVQEALSSLNSSRQNLMKQIDEDMSNKENNRRSFIQGIKQQCQLESEKVVQVRSRRSTSDNMCN
ncbi:unnamed protein product [Calicophoron daubneyi]|uniref:Uncharacterized protein n=1 Tax=Calicophoron daubneyi TaxID=300641 RepID=A0AAV2TPN9_CALDB